MLCNLITCHAGKSPGIPKPNSPLPMRWLLSGGICGAAEFTNLTGNAHCFNGLLRLPLNAARISRVRNYSEPETHSALKVAPALNC